AAERGEADWPYEVFRSFWPHASADSFGLDIDLKRLAPVGRPSRSAAAAPVFMAHDAGGSRA
ncbi:MAG: hypothetical protein EBT24_13205, partial [Betaproteobacteria bacterium]|nr:hypothetical protein [Betaproteobacteria bacterium]